MSDSDFEDSDFIMDDEDDDFDPGKATKAKKSSSPKAKKQSNGKDKAPKPKASKPKNEMSGTVNGANGTEMPPEEKGKEKAGAGGSKKRLSVERIYQKKSQLEHILLRPDTYIGSVNPVTERMWVLDADTNRIISKEITYVPGLYKIFDEILVNAADNKVRDSAMDIIKIDINPEKNEIKIFNNGRGIPVEHHKTENMYVPTLIFGHLLTSSNFNDEEEKVTGGRNGYGAKLCNVFSNKFTVETASKENKQEFKQSWSTNMGKAGEPKLKDFNGSDYTRITFYPDLPKFNMDKLDDDTVALLSRRAYDVAASTKGVKVYLNGKKIPIKNFKDYVDLFLKGHEDETGNQIKCVHEVANTNWEVAVAMSDNGFQQMSFVNSIATTKGGRHVDYVSKMIESNVAELVKKKNKGGVTIKPHQIRNHLWVFINCLIPNPTFDSQTKENMTLQQSKFTAKAAFKCQLSPKFFQQVQKSGIVESVLAWSKFKADQELSKKQSSKKTNKVKGISKLEDANHAGTKNSIDCTLILTEGDSAKSLAVAGLSVLGRDKYGVFPLRGKLLNVREATHKQIMENKEINELVKIIGLQYKKKYDSPDDLKTLRYGKLMIMTDQDQDGSHIKGLVINFIHHNWPGLLRLHFLEEFITPIVKASKANFSQSFYSLPEFNEWKAATSNWHTYKIKYYKGLGTSTDKEAKEYFSDVKRHRILFRHRDNQDDHSINMAFSKKCIDQRKTWLTGWMEECKRRKELGLPEIYLYEKDTKVISYQDFVNKELILFSNLDNERSIPCLVDGFKPGQRKVMFTCLKRDDKREVKVAQLAGSVGEMSAYHHGEASLMGTIINLAQNFVGSNNINLLLPNGQFGTRSAGGKDHASPRYIFTLMSPLTRLIFNKSDSALLNYLKDDNQKVEPEWYVPILPMVLVNGADGIGTGWMTKIPNYNPREIVTNLKRKLDGLDMIDMTPWFKNFNGEITPIDNQRYIISGEINNLSEKSIEITELPVRTWTATYKEQVLETYMTGSEKQAALIQDYSNYSTNRSVRFVVQMDKEKLKSAELKGLHQFFKLQTSLSTSSMVLFDAKGCLRRYDSVLQIMEEFFEVRLEYYRKRKEYLEGELEAQALKLSNQARFILEKCDGSLVIENKAKKAMIEELQRKGFDSDPEKKWKKAREMEENSDAELDSEDEDTIGDADYGYLLGMPMWNLTKEKKEELMKEKDKKHKELNVLRSTSKEDLWRKDLDEFLEKLDEVEEKEKEEDLLKDLNEKSGDGKKKKKKLQVHKECTPAGIRVAPRIGEELRKKAAQAAAAKSKKDNKKTKKDEPVEEKDEWDLMCDDKELNTSLSEKLGLDLKKKSKSVKSKMMSDSEDNMSWKSDSGSDSDDLPSVSKKPRVERAAAKKKSKYEEKSSESEEDILKTEQTNKKSWKDDSDSDLDDFDAIAKKSKKPLFEKAAPAKKKSKYVESSESDEEFLKTEPTTKKSWKDDSDSDLDDFDVIAKKSKKPQVEKAAPAKKKSKYVESSESDEEFMSTEPTTKKSWKDDSDVDEFDVVSKKAAKSQIEKSAPAKKKSKYVESSESEDDILKSKATKKSLKKDDELGAKRPRAGRAAAQKKSKYEESSESEEEFKPKTTKKSRKKDSDSDDWMASDSD